MKQIIILLLIALSVRSNSQDYDKYFDEYGVKGSFMMYDMNNDKFLYVDSARCMKGFIPASTFKIPNSIIGLETGVIADENFVIPWDGKSRWKDCDKDLSLKEAIKYSCIAYYQELARKVGEDKMKEFLAKFDYGNKDISAGLDLFWLEGGFRISQAEQIGFLKKMYNYELPVSKRSIDIVKNIIVLDSTENYVLRGKTGWGFQDEKNIGWLVGWLETGGNAYFYATNIESEKETESFAQSRRTITEKIFRDLGLMK
ncbi:MAG: class D beta-lactamase [Ignavibacteria bacterium]|nr:class D beta-lactamase [Ignavibacteria bacterium]